MKTWPAVRTHLGTGHQLLWGHMLGNEEGAAQIGLLGLEA